ncbi:MAB_1171c family putative transporter [Streptomyces sp. NPDC006514]|uniref:MAB_1171c family putative transporter n=1 Tax=Streptomyces sp. NPDC006514 TaxID=3154308 RepID=UPI0033AAF03D
MSGRILPLLPASLMVLALLIKIPTLRRDWDQPLNRTACALLTVGAPINFLATPSTIASVNRHTGVVNFSAPLVFGLCTVFSGLCVVLVLQWRGGPPATVRRATRLTTALFGAATAAIVVLFVIGDAPVERLRDLDTYYATTPWIREMIVCFLVAHTLGTSALTWLCGKWLARADRALRPLRTGLALIVVAGLMDLAYLAAKWASVVARWTGHDLVFLSTDVAPPLAGAAGLLLGAGFVVPLVGGSATWLAYGQYRRLRPLWKALRGFAATQGRTVPLAWWSPVGIRLIHRESVIDDGILALAGWFDPRVHGAAYEAARARGLSEARAATVADAAVLAAACQRKAAAAHGAVPGPASGLQPYRLGRQPLTALAHAFRTSDIVTAARDAAAAAAPDPDPDPVGA